MQTQANCLLVVLLVISVTTDLVFLQKLGVLLSEDLRLLLKAIHSANHNDDAMDQVYISNIRH